LLGSAPPCRAPVLPACALRSPGAGTILAVRRRAGARRDAPAAGRGRVAMTAIRSRSGRDRTRGRGRVQLTVGITLVPICSLAGVAQAGGKQKFCSATARTLFAACKDGVAGDALVRKAVCINVSGAAQQAECRGQAKADHDEASQLCQGQRDTRLATCELLGEGRYEPPSERSLFADPENQTN